MTQLTSGVDPNPWDIATLTEPAFAEVGPSVQIAEGDRMVTLSELYYAGAQWLGRPTRVFAYYARPTSVTSPLPAMVLVHGGGGTASPEWAALWAGRGYAAIAMDLYGRGRDGRRLPDGGCDWGDLDIAFRLTAGVENGWIYQAVANAVRAVSVLRELDGVDPERIGMTGVSWGGSLTCFAMSLDDRLRLAIPVYGFGFNPRLGLPPDPTDEERRLVRGTFEPGLYLPRCRMPVLWVNGTQEPYATLESMQQSYRAAQGPRTLSVTVRPSHIDPQMADRGWERAEPHLFADSHFRGTPGLPAVRAMEIAGGVARASYQTPVPLANAAVHWTADVDSDGPARRWQSAWAKTGEPGVVEAVLPSERPAIVFMTLMDQRGAVVSTEHARLPEGAAAH